MIFKYIKKNTSCDLSRYNALERRELCKGGKEANRKAGGFVSQPSSVKAAAGISKLALNPSLASMHRTDVGPQSPTQTMDGNTGTANSLIFIFLLILLYLCMFVCSILKIIYFSLLLVP